MEGIPVSIAEEGPPFDPQHQTAIFRALKAVPDATVDYVSNLSPIRLAELIATFVRVRNQEPRPPAGIPDKEDSSALRIQRAYRGYRGRKAFFDLIAKMLTGPMAAGDGHATDEIYIQIANRSARKFWDVHFGERRPSLHEVLSSIDTWLEAGGIDDHERPEVVRRVGLALDTSGDDGAQLSFENLQVFSRHIVPFTPNKVKAAVLSDSFHELHDCLNAAHLSATGWSAGSYLKLISNTDARSWWADCIGEKRVHDRGMKNALGAWLHCRHAELHAGTDADYYASAELSHELSEQEIRTVLARISDCDVLFTTGQNYVSWAEWNDFVDTWKVVPFTAQSLAEIVLSDRWTHTYPPDKAQLNNASSSESHSLDVEHGDTKPNPSATPAMPRALPSYAVEFRIQYDALDIGDKIGDGGYGSVFKAVWKTGHVSCAVKMLHGADSADSGSDDGEMMPSSPRDDFERETALLRELHHPNLVTCYGMCPGGPGVPRCLIEELCLSSLDSVLHGHKVSGSLSGVAIGPARLLRMCMGIAAALAYIHSRGIVHRDMKAGNVLLDQYKQVKICDFGISAFLPATNAGDAGDLDLGSGTPAMMAPELFAEVSPDPHPSVDIYALGVLLWEMATRERPWSAVHPASLPNLVVKEQKRPPLPRTGAGEGVVAGESVATSPHQQAFSPKFEALVVRCWDQDPLQRPTASEVYNALKQSGGIHAEGGTN